MEIIRKGSLPEDEWYEGTCSNCLTRVKFQRKEAKKSAIGSSIEVVCPLSGCGRTISNTKKFREHETYWSGRD